MTRDCPLADFLATMLAASLLLLAANWALELAGACAWRWWYGRQG